MDGQTQPTFVRVGKVQMDGDYSNQSKLVALLIYFAHQQEKELNLLSSTTSRILILTPFCICNGVGSYAATGRVIKIAICCS